jgi:hypothetical protein
MGSMMSRAIMMATRTNSAPSPAKKVKMDHSPTTLALDPGMLGPPMLHLHPLPTEKVARQDKDVPFHKLSRGAKDKIPRGWFREAAIQLKTDTGRIFYAQCSTWKDKKQVMFLSTEDIGASEGHFVYRSTRGQKARSTLSAPVAQKSYAKHYGAVDRNDRDSADYSTSIRTNRWYLRILCWLLDRVVHILYVIVSYCAVNGIGPEYWKLYLLKIGRRNFQIDLGREIITYAIRHAWTNLDGPKSSWMRQSDLIPCACRKCFFCLNGLTSGITHKKRKSTVTTFVQHDNTRRKTVDCTDVRVDLQKGTSHCRQCYRERPGTKEQKMEKIPHPRLGCPSCDEVICKKCWAKGYDMHQKPAAKR